MWFWSEHDLRTSYCNWYLSQMLPMTMAFLTLLSVTNAAHDRGIPQSLVSLSLVSPFLLSLLLFLLLHTLALLSLLLPSLPLFSCLFLSLSLHHPFSLTLPSLCGCFLPYEVVEASKALVRAGLLVVVVEWREGHSKSLAKHDTLMGCLLTHPNICLAISTSLSLPLSCLLPSLQPHGLSYPLASATALLIVCMGYNWKSQLVWHGLEKWGRLSFQWSLLVGVVYDCEILSRFVGKLLLVQEVVIVCMCCSVERLFCSVEGLLCTCGRLEKPSCNRGRDVTEWKFRCSSSCRWPVPMHLLQQEQILCSK